MNLKKKTLLIFAGITTFVAGLVVGLTGNFKSNTLKTKADEEYSMLFVGRNQASQKGYSTWNNVTTAEGSAKQFVRQTNLGNNVTFKTGNFKVDGTGTETWSDFGGLDGTNAYYYNDDPLTGITKIVLNIKNDSSEKLYIDFGYEPLNYSSSEIGDLTNLPAGVEERYEITGATNRTTYQTFVPSVEGEYCYYRIQNLGTNKVSWLLEIEMFYSCKSSYTGKTISLHGTHDSLPNPNGLNNSEDRGYPFTRTSSDSTSITFTTGNGVYNDGNDDFAGLLGVNGYFYNTTAIDGIRHVELRFKNDNTQDLYLDIGCEPLTYASADMGDADHLPTGVAQRFVFNAPNNRTTTYRFMADTFNYYSYLRIQNAASAADNGKKSWVLEVNIVYSGKVEHEEPRGEEFFPATDYSKDIPNTQLDEFIFIDIKFTSAPGTRINVFLGDGWDHYFGYYNLNASYADGATPYQGVEVKYIEHGYIRFIFDLSSLNKVNQIVGGEDKELKKINLIHARHDWNDASGYIDIVLGDAPERDYRGIFLKSASYDDLYVCSYDTSTHGVLTFDYIYADPVTDIDHGVSMFFGTDMDNCFGSIKIFYDHLADTYNGVSFETLTDDYNRVTINVDELTKVYAGTPTKINKIMFKWFEASKGVYFDVNHEGNGKDAELQMSGDSFKFLDFTDIHIQKAEHLAVGSSVRKTIEYGMSNSNPDAVVFSGDFVHTSNVTCLDDLCTFMDTFEVPYFFILGNHDRDDISIPVLAQHIWKSQYGYFDLGPSEFEGAGNYVVRIKNSSGDLVHALIMMDTRNKYDNDPALVEYVTESVDGVHYGQYKGKKTYCEEGWDGVRGGQIDWYKDQVTALGCETTVIMHAGMVEYTKAYENYRRAIISGVQSDIDACAPIGPCHMKEYCCGPCSNYGFFAAIKEMNSTKNVICGHDHVNDFSLLYQGVRLTYALKTGNGAYGGTADQSGYTSFGISNTGSTSLEQVFYNYNS